MRNYDFVDGFVWRYGWSLLQDDTGTHFDPVTNILQKAEANGLKVTIYIMGPEPIFVRNQIPSNQKWYDTNPEPSDPHLPNQPDIGLRGIPWAPKLLTSLESFAPQLANWTVYSSILKRNVLVKDHPALKTISFGLQGGDKWIRDPGKTTGLTIVTMGPTSGPAKYSRALLYDAVQRNINAAVVNFPTKVYSLGFWTIMDDNLVPNYSVTQYLLDQLQTAFGSRVGFFQENLGTYRNNPMDMNYIGHPTTDYAFPLFNSKDWTFCGFQMTEPYITGDDPVKNSIPSEGMDYAFANFGSQYAEVYVSDLDNEYCTPAWDNNLTLYNDIYATDFHDSFESGVTSWTPAGGTWTTPTVQILHSGCPQMVTVNETVYQQGNNTTNLVASSSYNLSSAWTDYSFEAQVTPLGYAGTVGLSARATNNLNRYYFQYNLLSQQLQIQKIFNGGMSTVGLPTSLILTPGTTHKFKADLHGSTLEFYVDNVLQCSGTDSTFTAGKIALSTISATAQFDKVKVILH